MSDWGVIRAIPVGGLVAVGFVDERRVMIGSHGGLGIIDAQTGAVLDRVPDTTGDYAWFQESPPAARYVGHDGEFCVPVAGLWGGALSATTRDGWAWRIEGAGAILSGPDGSLLTVNDVDEPRAGGFSPLGQVFVFATSATLHIAARAAG